MGKVVPAAPVVSATGARAARRSRHARLACTGEVARAARLCSSDAGPTQVRRQGATVWRVLICARDESRAGNARGQPVTARAPDSRARE